MPQRRARHHALPRRPPDGRPAPRRRADGSSVGHRRQARRHRRRRALHGPHRSRGARRAGRLRPARSASRWPCSIDRGGRELPIQPDVVGKTVEVGVARARGRAGRGARWRGRRGHRAARGASDDVTAVARQGPARARAAHARADSPHSRHRRAVQGDQRAGDQEGADAARLDDRQPVLRGVDAHAHLVRVRREAAVGRHGERRRVGVERVARARRSSTRRAISRRCGSTWS